MLGSDELTDAAEDVVECSRLDGGVDASGGQGRVEGQEISGITSDVRGGHRSPGEELGSARVPG